ncbi:MAG: hypothetical protein AB7E61_06250 [Acholeplasmataceae bacterium]
MATRPIDSEIWRDPKMTDDFTPEDKYFWLYCLTNPYANLSGAYEISIKQISDDLGYNDDTVKNLIYRFTNIHKMITYIVETKEIFIHNWYRYNWTKSPKFETALYKYIAKIKDEDLRKLLYEMYENYKNGDTVSIRYRYGSNTNTNTIFNYEEDLKDQIKEETKEIIIPIKKVKKEFIPPTREDVHEYIKERKSNVDGDKFYDFFTEGKWIDSNGKPVNNWKQKLITWENHSPNKKEETHGTSKEAAKQYTPRRQRST